MPLRLSHDRRLQLLALGAGAPGVAVALAALARWNGAPGTRLAAAAVVLGTWGALGALVRRRALRPLQTLANLLAALREGDFSFRAKAPDRRDPLGEVFAEINALGDLLQGQRLGALEATALLRAVMAEIDVAVLAFDEGGSLRLVNRAGEDLLGRPRERLLGRSAEALGLAEVLAGESPRLVDLALPGRSARWELRRSVFRQGGRPHQLLVLSDLTRPLREEERQAWQRLIRVLSHELNNSLAPIQSLADSLATLARRDPLPEDWREDLLSGLGVIGSRSSALNRFLEAYARLARLPAPRKRPLEAGDWIRRIAQLEPRVPVRLEPGPELAFEADGDQLDQLLLNLLKNAADASLETGGSVRVAWSVGPSALEVVVEDEGPGLPPSANLFVPFFTTKAGGSGIGLVLSRQVAEAHGGTLALENRKDRPGARAVLRLPL